MNTKKVNYLKAMVLITGLIVLSYSACSPFQTMNMVRPETDSNNLSSANDEVPLPAAAPTPMPMMPPAPPQPQVQQPPWPNEPAGATVMLDCGFDTPTCGGKLFDGYNTVANGTLSVQQDNTAPLSPSNVMRSTMNYQRRNGGTQLERQEKIPLTEVFVGLWWRSNPEFNGSTVGANKMFFIRGGPSQNGVFVWARRPGVSRLYWTTQLPYNLDQCGGLDLDQCYGNTGNFVDFEPGIWYRIEVYMKASSCPTCRDGIARWWITRKGGSPVLVGNYSNFAYGPLLNEWVWSETWDGGGSGTGFTSDPSHFIDHLRISAPNKSKLTVHSAPANQVP